MYSLQIFVLAILGFSQVYGWTLDCPKMCPAIYSPVCASDGEKYVQFSNLCRLKVFNCERQRSSSLPALKKTDFEWCSTVNLDEQEYDLDLDLDNKSCNKACPMIFKPVCGSNGTYRKSFSNECVMRSFDCMLKNKSFGESVWKVLKRGQCPKTNLESF